MGDAVLRGKVLRFDEVRGYGFITPDNGDEDVFVHANDLGVAKAHVRPGSVVEFEVEEGERGLKASWVRLVNPSAAVDARRPASAPSLSPTSPGGDVLSSVEFLYEITEALIEAAPTLTGAQIIAARQQLTKLARGHGWIEDGTEAERPR